MSRPCHPYPRRLADLPLRWRSLWPWRRCRRAVRASLERKRRAGR